MLGTVRSLFWNSDERRLRALWRFCIAFVVYLVLTVVLSLVFGVIGLSTLVVGVLGTTALASLIASTFVLGLTDTVFVALLGFALDRRRFADFGFHIGRDWWIDFGFGLLLGVALQTLIFVTELAAGWIRVVDFATARGGSFLGLFVATVVLFLFVGFHEELLSRGYVLTNVAEGLSGVDPFDGSGAILVAVLCSSGLFALLHTSNPNATAVSTLGIFVAGFLLAAGYVFTGELAISIGLHVTWNLFEGVVYGFPVSGLDLPVRVFAIRQLGPRVVTGGPFGPEAGLSGMAAAVVGCLAIALWVRWRTGTARFSRSIVTPELRDR